MVALCLLACWLSMASLLAIIESFPSQTPNSGKYRFDKYSTDRVSVTVPLVVATCRIAMDTVTISHDSCRPIYPIYPRLVLPCTRNPFIIVCLE